MGWDFSNRPKGMTTRAYFEREFSHGTPDARTEFLGTAMVGSTFYAAVHVLGTDEVYALVCLTQRARGYFNFGYKDMDETMGPDAAEMPSKLLDMLSPTENEWALSWRSRCRQNAHRATVAASLQRGDIIKITSSPLQFRGYAGDVREIEVRDAKRGYFAALENEHATFMFSLGSRWATERGWEIIRRA